MLGSSSAAPSPRGPVTPRPCHLPGRPMSSPPAPLPRSELPARLIIELLRSGQSARFIARGGSMWPSVPARSQIELEPCPAAQLRVGQLAAFEHRGQVIVHRVTRITPEGVHFQGDNLDQPDGIVAASQVLGRARVVARRRWRARWPEPGELTRAARALLRLAVARLSRALQ